MRTFIGLVLFLAVSPSFALAARPLSTDDAGTVERQHLEIECGFEYVNQTDSEYNWTTTLKYGLSERWDMGVEIPYKYIDVSAGDNVDGLSDIVFCSKYGFFDGAEGLPALALSFNIKTKSGDEDKGLGTGATDYGITTILTKAFKKTIAHLNLGYTYVGAPEGQAHDDVFSYALALEYPLNDKLNLVGELSGETNFEGDFDDNAFAGLAGFNYSLSDTATFDFGVGWGISEASSDYSITSGLTLSF